MTPIICGPGEPTPGDLVEVEKFQRFLNLVADGADRAEAYKRIYGEEDE